MHLVQRHMDEYPAAVAGEEWIVELGRAAGCTRIESLRDKLKNGGVRLVWKDDILIAYFLCIRDTHNHTLLLCHDLRDQAQPSAPAPAYWLSETLAKEPWFTHEFLEDEELGYRLDVVWQNRKLLAYVLKLGGLAICRDVRGPEFNTISVYESADYENREMY
ncbi:hypothetical protein ACYPKM_03920 [Pseudomonas aeruginosa]